VIVGLRVEQHVHLDDGNSEVVESGVVLACQRSGSPAKYTLLVMRVDGTLVELPAELMTIKHPDLASSPLRRQQLIGLEETP
jgi:hypothetical protein